MVLEIDVMDTTFWGSPSSCMLDRLECVCMNGVKLIRTGVGEHIVLFYAFFWFLESRI